MSDLSLKQMTEDQVRALRDKVYCQKSTNYNWEECKHRWLTEESVKWLQEKSNRELRDYK